MDTVSAVPAANEYKKVSGDFLQTDSTSYYTNSHQCSYRSDYSRAAAPMPQTNGSEETIMDGLGNEKSDIYRDQVTKQTKDDHSVVEQQARITSSTAALSSSSEAAAEKEVRVVVVGSC
jgi:hypothetical protein